MMNVRRANAADRDDVFSIYGAAFPEGERECIAALAVDLLVLETDPVTFALVAEAEGIVVGHVAFSPVTGVKSKKVLGYILAPLAVNPMHQRQGVGSLLVADGIRRLSDMGMGVVFVYGDPKYYGRFGFRADMAESFIPPYDLQYPFGWQAMVLDKTTPSKPTERIACVAPLCAPALW